MFAFLEHGTASMVVVAEVSYKFAGAAGVAPEIQKLMGEEAKGSKKMVFAIKLISFFYVYCVLLNP